MGEYGEIYPNLQKDGEVSGANFRLSSITAALGELRDEVKHYEKVRNKYAKAHSILSKTSVTTGITLRRTLCQRIGDFTHRTWSPIVGVPLGVIGGLFGLTSVACSAGAKKLTRGLSKHNQTVALAKGKVSTVSDLVSKALTDGQISDTEFSLVSNEIRKYEKE